MDCFGCKGCSCLYGSYFGGKSDILQGICIKSYHIPPTEKEISYIIHACLELHYDFLVMKHLLIL
jgi:hypothetical protein